MNDKEKNIVQFQVNINLDITKLKEALSQFGLICYSMLSKVGESKKND